MEKKGVSSRAAGRLRANTQQQQRQAGRQTAGPGAWELKQRHGSADSKNQSLITPTPSRWLSLPISIFLESVQNDSPSFRPSSDCPLLVLHPHWPVLYLPQTSPRDLTRSQHPPPSGEWQLSHNTETALERRPLEGMTLPSSSSSPENNVLASPVMY